MGLKVMVAVPTHDSHPAMFGYDLAQMMAWTASNLMGGPDAPISAMNLAYCTGTYIHSARQQLAELALKIGADYILWLDSDMRFPKDTLARLLLHKQDIVGVNYSTRGVPPKFVAIKDSAAGERLPTTEKSSGLEPAEAIGFGVVLMRTAVLGRLHDPKEEGPWFFYRWREDTRSMVGEDVFFAELMEKAGVEIMVDHDLSKEVRHIGSFEYSPAHVTAMEEEDVNHPA